MAGKRMLAVLAAVIMVVGAVAIRSWIDDGGELTLDTDASTTVYCETALAEQCREAFDADVLQIEAPGATLDRFVDNRIPEPAIWVAADIWFEILEDERERNALPSAISDTSEVIANSPLVIFGDCDSWKCMAESDGSVDIGLDPLDTSTGLLSYGQIVAAHLGRADFASNDFDAGFRSWRTDLEAHLEFARLAKPALDVALTQPGVYDVVTATEAAVIALGREVVVPADGTATVDISVAAIGNGVRLPGRVDDLTDALVDSGWERGPGAEVEGPSGGALQALRTQ